MRLAIIAVLSLAVNALLVAWLVPPERDQVEAPVEEDDEPLAEAPRPREMFVEVVVLDAPASARAAIGATKARGLGAARASVAAPATTAPAAAASEVAPAVVVPPARDYYTMRRPDVSLARLVERARDEAPPPPAPVRDGELRPAGGGTYATDLGGSHWTTRTATAHVARDGTVKFEDAPDFDIHYAGLGVVGKFNADDWLARRAGIDPYASAKLRFLDRTREARVRIAEVNRADDLAQAQRALRRNLDAARAIADPAERKRALFELWDDVAETGDAALVAAGAGARAYLVGAIRAMRPVLEFTPDELAQLNAHRRSTAIFAPYE